MDITPLIPQGRQIVTAYGDGGITINGAKITGSVLVFLDCTLPWDADITPESLRPVLESDAVELLLLGTGRNMIPPSPALRHALRAKGIALEAMDTGAACRTYNVLMSEGRRVAAALVAV